MEKISFFWFRRDLRIRDNAALFKALKDSEHVQPLFIFDHNILNLIENKKDARVTFIYETLEKLKQELHSHGSDLWVYYGTPQDVYTQLLKKYDIKSVYASTDYEPYARHRDYEISTLLKSHGADLKMTKDQVLYAKDEVLTGQGTPYTVYTPYKKKVMEKLKVDGIPFYDLKPVLKNLHQVEKAEPLLRLADMGFEKSSLALPSSEVIIKNLVHYDKTRDFPYLPEGTSRLGLHLRFGTVSVRELAKIALKTNEVWLSELIWRDFFMQILWNFPRSESESFRPQYDQIAWREAPQDFDRWANGQTGYPIVDAGMRELVHTGHMHNRVRMIVASFLTKHLLIHWKRGERFFAKHLLDFDLSANVGNWQWAAGSGCDAAPYFRVFNPETQTEKFDPDHIYIKKWVPEYKSLSYPQPMVEHTFARQRALHEYGRILKSEDKK